MNRLTFVIVCLLCELVYFQTLAQYSRVIKIPTKYSQEGVIFDSLYNAHILIKNMQSRFTPSLEEIDTTENILEKYYANNLADYYRQYLGYTDTEGHKIIITQLINSKIKKRKYIYIEPWRYEFLNGFGAFYEINIRLCYVDIIHKKLL